MRFDQAVKRRRADLLVMSGPGLTPEMKALLAPPKRDKMDGFLVLEGWGGRTGVQIYNNDYGTGGIVREYRPPEEVHAQKSLDTYEGKPFTNDHPATFVTTETSDGLSKGAILSVTPYPDIGWNKVCVAIQSADAIAALDAGKVQLSLGYYAHVELTSGVTPEGEHYDCIQRGIHINHLALVDIARAGAAAQLRLDSAGDVVLGDPQPPQPSPRGDSMEMIEITLPDGRKVRVHKDDAQAILAHHAALQGRADTAQAQLDQLRTDHARQSGELDQVRADLATRNDVNIDELVQRRADLLTEAAPLLPEGYDARGRTDALVRLDALVHQVPADSQAARRADLEARDAAYVEGAYSVLVQSVAAGRRHVDGLRSSVHGARRNDTPGSVPDKTPAQKRLDAAKQKEAEVLGWAKPSTTTTTGG